MNAVAKKEAAPKKAAAKKASAKGASGVVANSKLYDVLVRPVITEKAQNALAQNKVVFKISPTASKTDVKRAVEALFNVSVLKVNTVSIEGKTKRFRGQPGQRSDTRKAIVTLAEGQSIDLSAGLR